MVGLGGGRILFSNPASTKREKVTVRISEDGGKTWSVGTLLHEGPSAYSDLVVEPEGGIGCLYEAGDEVPYEKLVYARFTKLYVK